MPRDSLWPLGSGAVVKKLGGWSQIVIVFAIFINNSDTLQGQALQPGEPNAQLRSFTPNEGEVLIKGAPLSVTANVNLIPSASESVEFTGRITIKNRRFRPFVTVLTQSTTGSGVTGCEVMTWPTRVPGPKSITIRLELTGVGKSSGREFSFASLTRTYSVKCNPKEWWFLRRLHHMFGCCLN